MSTFHTVKRAPAPVVVRTGAARRRRAVSCHRPHSLCAAASAPVVTPFCYKHSGDWGFPKSGQIVGPTFALSTPQLELGGNPGGKKIYAIISGKPGSAPNRGRQNENIGRPAGGAAPAARGQAGSRPVHVG